MATPISGINGTVTVSGSAVALVTKWTATFSESTFRHADNGSSGYKKTYVGAYHAEGTVEGLFDSDAVSALLVGASVTLVLKMSSSRSYSVPAIIKSIAHDVDIDEGSPTPFRAEWESNGAWTAPTFS